MDVFYNSMEFAEILTFYIDKEQYKGPVVREEGSVKNRTKSEADNITSLDMSEITAYIPLAVLGKVPRKGVDVQFDKKLYTISEVLEDMGQVILTLAAVIE